MVTLYDAWASGHRWVVFRGFLCRVMLPPAYGIGAMGKNHIDVFWVSHLGNWRHPRCRFNGNFAMNFMCKPIEPNSKEFKYLYRKNYD